MPRRLPPNGLMKVWTDLLPAEERRSHGKHIYMFRHIRTNQIVYTLYPRLTQRSLKQLPFIGKHSVPPSIRADYWTPFCRVGPFASPEQGTDALQTLFSLRKLHQLCWKDENPNFKILGKKHLIKKLMDQKTNSVADLAKVLELQHRKAGSMELASTQRIKEQTQFLDKRWAELEKIALSVDQGAIQDLEKKIRDCKSLLGEKKNDKKASAELQARIKRYEREIPALKWTHNIVQRLAQSQRQIDQEHNKTVARLDTEREELRNAGQAAKAEQIKNPRKRDNRIRMSLLPAALKSKPTPFEAETIEIEWADLEDANHAEKWPKCAVHGVMEHVTAKRKNGFITELEWDIEAIRAQQREEVERILQGPSPVSEEAVLGESVAPKKTGIWQYLPTLSNPFSRGSARSPL